MAASEPAELGVDDRTGDTPVKWWVFDNWCSPCETVGEIPPPASPVWEAVYANDCERGKRTTRATGVIPHYDAVLARMRAGAGEWSARLGYPVEDDPTLHGGGLHVTAPSGYLQTHLDYDLHPIVLGKRRALNLIAFLNPEWREEWGGAFVLTDPMGVVVRRILPEPGRLIAFEVCDTSYHGVEKITGPVERITAAAYYLSAATPGNTRRRALFLPCREA